MGLPLLVPATNWILPDHDIWCGTEPGIQFDGTDDVALLSATEQTAEAGDVLLVFTTQAAAFTAEQTILACSDVSAANKYAHIGIDADGFLFIEVNDAGTEHRVTCERALELSTKYAAHIWSDGSAWGIQFGRANVQDMAIVTTDNSGKWFGDIGDNDAVTLGALRTSGGDSNHFTGTVHVCGVSSALHGAAAGLRERLATVHGVQRPAIYEGEVEPTWAPSNIDNWAVNGTGVTESAETTITRQGSALRMDYGATATMGYEDHTFSSPVDLSAINAFYIRFYVSDKASFSVGRLYFFGGASGTSDYFDKSFAVRTGWNYWLLRREDFSTTGSPNWNSIRVMRYRQSRVAGTPFTVLDALALQKKNPVATLILASDDGNDTNYVDALPVLAARGLKMTAYVNTSNIGSTGKLTRTQLDELYAAGWDICSHSNTHTDGTGLTEQQLHDEYGTAFDSLTEWGFEKSAHYHAYPFNAYNDTCISVAQQYFRNARTGQASTHAYSMPMMPALSPQSWTLFSHATDGLLLSEFQTLIDAQIAMGGVLITYGHYFNDVDFAGWMDYAIAKRDAGQLRIMTMSEYYAHCLLRFGASWRSHEWSA